MFHALDRRSFLQSAAAAAGAGLLGSRGQSADEFNGFKLGVQSYTFRNFDLEPALKRTKELGLKYAEFYQKHIPANSSPDKLKAILALCKEYEVAPIAYGVQGFSKNHDANKKMFEFGAAIGVKAFSADPDPDSFDSLDKLCDEFKIAIAIHPHGPVGGGKLHRWYSAQVILKAVKDHCPLIGSCLDTGHLIRSSQMKENLDPVEQIKLMGARNFGIHLKDHDNEKKEDVIFGDPKGHLDIAGVLKALRELKFQYGISIEYEAHPADPSPDMKKCVAVVKEAAAKLG